MAVPETIIKSPNRLFHYHRWLPLVGDPLFILIGWLRLNIYACALFILIGKAGRYLLIAGLIT